VAWVTFAVIAAVGYEGTLMPYCSLSAVMVGMTFSPPLRSRTARFRSFAVSSSAGPVIAVTDARRFFNPAASTVVVLLLLALPWWLGSLVLLVLSSSFSFFVL
jgi:hypothetical protein